MNEWMIEEQDADLVADLIDAEIKNAIKHADRDPDYIDRLEKVRIALDNATKVIIVRPVDDDGEPEGGNVYQFPTPDEFDVGYGDYA